MAQQTAPRGACGSRGASTALRSAPRPQSKRKARSRRNINGVVSTGVVPKSQICELVAKRAPEVFRIPGTYYDDSQFQRTLWLWRPRDLAPAPHPAPHQPLSQRKGLKREERRGNQSNVTCMYNIYIYIIHGCIHTYIHIQGNQTH